VSAGVGLAATVVALTLGLGEAVAVALGDGRAIVGLGDGVAGGVDAGTTGCGEHAPTTTSAIVRQNQRMGWSPPAKAPQSDRNRATCRHSIQA